MTDQHTIEDAVAVLAAFLQQRSVRHQPMHSALFFTAGMSPEEIQRLVKRFLDGRAKAIDDFDERRDQEDEDLEHFPDKSAWRGDEGN